MNRRPPTRAELGLDSLTDTMTNMMGLILLMVVIASVVSGGMKLSLLSHWSDPGERTPIYLVCTADRILFVHRGSEWRNELEAACGRLESQLGRKPTTSEALRELNKTGLAHSPDFDAVFVRETARLHGQTVYVIGIRFLPRDSATDFIEVERATDESDEHVLSRSAAEAIATADPVREYVDAFVYEDGFDTLLVLQRMAHANGLELGWRPLLKFQNPGLSETGVQGVIGGAQ